MKHVARMLGSGITAEDLALCVLICKQIVDGINALSLALSVSFTWQT